MFSTFMAQWKCTTTPARGNLSTFGEQYCLQFPNEQDIEQNEDDEDRDNGGPGAADSNGCTETVSEYMTNK